MVSYTISSLGDLAVVINHFSTYPLLSFKSADFNLFKLAYILISSKEHLTEEGFSKLLFLKAAINKGFSPLFKDNFPNIVPMETVFTLCPLKLMSNDWLSGFISAEGCFYVNAYKAKSKTGYKVTLRFKICLSDRETSLLKDIIYFFRLWNIIPKHSREIC